MQALREAGLAPTWIDEMIRTGSTIGLKATTKPTT